MFQLGNLLNYRSKTNIIGFPLFELDYILVKCRPSLMFCLLVVNSKIKGSDYLMLASLLWIWYDNIVLSSCENWTLVKVQGRTLLYQIAGLELWTCSASDGNCSSMCVSLSVQIELRVWNQTIFCLELSLEVSFAKLTQCTKTYESLWERHLRWKKAVSAFDEL